MIDYEFSVVGKSVPRIDAMQKVTGEAIYVQDIKLPGMLYGRVLRSPYAHAKIVRIDTRRAEKLKGVKAVITAADTPKIKLMPSSPALADQLVLQDKKVRFIGDSLAAVAATDLETAEEALELIEVEYEELPAIFDPEEAMKPGMVLIHEAENNKAIPTNVRQFGDVEKGFREADYIFEDTYTTQVQCHCPLEVHGCVAKFSSTGELTLWSSTQSPFFLQEQIALVLDMPISKVRVIKVYVGGGVRWKICGKPCRTNLLFFG